jgi:hypothetical protein
VYAVEASRLGSFWETRSILTSLRWLVKVHATTIQRKSSRLITISSKVYCLQIYLLNSNFMYMILDFQLSCMKSFKNSHLMHITNPTITLASFHLSDLLLSSSSLSASVTSPPSSSTPLLLHLFGSLKYM